MRSFTHVPRSVPIAFDQAVEAAIVTIDQLLVATGAAGDRVDAEILEAFLGEQPLGRGKDGALGGAAITHPPFRLCDGPG